MNSNRQLAAIMFTDIVEYTALMRKDSTKALELVRISKEIQKFSVEKSNSYGIPEEIKDSIYQPFFITKPIRDGEQTLDFRWVMILSKRMEGSWRLKLRKVKEVSLYWNFL